MFNPQAGYPFRSDNKPRNELFEFAKAWLGTTLAFALVYRHSMPLLDAVIIMGIAAGLGIVIHELAHRVVARRFGSQAHFFANDAMLVISVLLALTGFIFAAPGAVHHRGYLTKKQVGLVAAAGPASNMVIALLSLILIPIANMLNIQFLFKTAVYSYVVNSLLGIFNMIPYGPLDGAKIMDWDMRAFIAMASVGGLLYVVQYLPIAKTLFVFGF
ncbi:zinc metalloprotease [Herpetosiphon geysericola]|uniref:Peptidase M50 n=1 Tax=Herpetosiphon geysericola TaxID=70996 RepID=A0A0P6Y6E8_9CHLR|nr:hypothetical protein [Herpetosiphon geysericola]KPL91955.1 hypothetical protein SE18_00990 [Herpetosiphon geysericola]